VKSGAPPWRVVPTPSVNSLHPLRFRDCFQVLTAEEDFPRVFPSDESTSPLTGHHKLQTPSHPSSTTCLEHTTSLLSPQVRVLSLSLLMKQPPFCLSLIPSAVSLSWSRPTIYPFSFFVPASGFITCPRFCKDFSRLKISFRELGSPPYAFLSISQKESCYSPFPPTAPFFFFLSFVKDVIFSPRTLYSPFFLTV